ncbi:MAG: hypothetical protein FJ246_08285 [Nitrospira sp.]|nr:hypothetical protein [Nitrospira sp.]
MHRTVVIACFLVLGLGTAAGAASDSGETQKKKEDRKGTTVEDIGKGLKSAEQNIEKEIPKIGPAIGDLFKKATGKSSEKQSEQNPSRQGK